MSIQNAFWSGYYSRAKKPKDPAQLMKDPGGHSAEPNLNQFKAREMLFKGCENNVRKSVGKLHI